MCVGVFGITVVFIVIVGVCGDAVVLFAVCVTV